MMFLVVDAAAAFLICFAIQINRNEKKQHEQGDCNNQKCIYLDVVLFWFRCFKHLLRYNTNKAQGIGFRLPEKNRCRMHTIFAISNSNNLAQKIEWKIYIRNHRSPAVLEITFSKLFWKICTETKSETGYFRLYKYIFWYERLIIDWNCARPVHRIFGANKVIERQQQQQ